MASMGPRFCKRGNLFERELLEVLQAKLQWGHAFVSVETTVAGACLFSETLLQWGHAFVSVETSDRA